MILSRDRACCSPLCTGRSEQVDHILPVADGGDDSPENLRGVTTGALSTQRVSWLMAVSCSSVTDAPATVLWVPAPPVDCESSSLCASR